MRFVRPAVLLAACLVLGVMAGTARSDTAAPSGLHAFLLRADEPLRTTFSRTPSFAWDPVPGALHYEFELSLSTTFRDNSVVYADLNAATPVEAPPITLPWITGVPHSLYARVRAITPDGATPWSAGYGFDMVPPAPPAPLPSYPGLLRWTPVEGALAYQIWLVDAHKTELSTTNTLDEREFYTFHPTTSWMGTVRWRIRALRTDVNSSGRLNGIPAVQYGAWSPIYSSSNGAFNGGPLKLVGTVSDVFSDGSASSPAHRLMPAFLWTGNQTLSGTPAELFRVYVFTDKQCLNRVYTSAVIGTPAYAPRASGPLALPTTAAGVAAARSKYLGDGGEPASFTYDGDSVMSTESQPQATPTTSVPGSPGEAAPSAAPAPTTPSGSASAPAPAQGGLSWTGNLGAPIDLWDTDWPSSGYYWTVVPVSAGTPGAASTNVAGSGAKIGDTTLPVLSTAGFSSGDTVSIGTGATAESATVTGINGNVITLATKLTFGHGAGEPVARTGGSFIYQDLELPQDVCAAGRVARFGKESEPSLTSSGDLFATGLSSTGRLTSALHTTAFYGQPLVSWTPALGAEAYEVQWSKTRYPFNAELTSSGAHGFMTASTSVVLPVGPGVWWYRVRGFDYSLPTGAQQMSWSDPARLVVAKPTFKIIGGGSSAKPATPAKTSRPTTTSQTAAGMRRVAGDGFTIDLPATWTSFAAKDSILTFFYMDPSGRGDVNVLRVSGRAGRSFAQWSADLVAQDKQALHVTPSASLATLPDGKAVRLDLTVKFRVTPIREIQYAVDAGPIAYVVTFAAPAASYASQAALFSRMIATFRHS